MLNTLLDFLFPPRCAFCKNILSSPHPVCSQCMKKLPLIGKDICRFCGRPLGEFSHDICSACRSEKIYYKNSFVPLLYKEDVRGSLLSLKYYNHPYYAKPFAFLIADRILSSEKYTAFDFITFVPQSPLSKFTRGYNQSYLIAKELSRLLKLPCVSTLERSNFGKRQAQIKSAKERKENVKKSYSAKNKTFSGKVLLVDDIYTTGATANYCSKLLLGMGFSEVYLAIAAIKE